MQEEWWKKWCELSDIVMKFVVGGLDSAAWLLIGFLELSIWNMIMTALLEFLHYMTVLFINLVHTFHWPSSFLFLSSLNQHITAIIVYRLHYITQSKVTLSVKTSKQVIYTYHTHCQEVSRGFKTVKNGEIRICYTHCAIRNSDS